MPRSEGCEAAAATLSAVAGHPAFFTGTARRSGASIRPGHRTRINPGCAHGFWSVPVRGIGVIRVIRVQPLAPSGQHGIPAGLASPPSAARSEGQVGQREGKNPCAWNRSHLPFSHKKVTDTRHIPRANLGATAQGDGQASGAKPGGAANAGRIASTVRSEIDAGAGVV